MESVMDQCPSSHRRPKGSSRLHFLFEQANIISRAQSHRGGDSQSSQGLRQAKVRDAC